MLHQVVGHWTFVLDTERYTRDQRQEIASCRMTKIDESVQFHFDKSTELDMELTMFDVIIQHSPEELEGKYTLLMHEGILARIGNMEFNTFWRHNHIGDGIYESICYETTLGWYHILPEDSSQKEEWGCFYAYKNHVTEAERDPKNHAKMDYDGPLDLVFENPRKIEYMLKEHESKGKLLFKLDSHASVAKTSEYLRSSPNSNSDYNSNSDSLMQSENSSVLDFSLVGRDPKTITEKDLPEYLNWANVNGESFFPEIRGQQ